MRHLSLSLLLLLACRSSDDGEERDAATSDAEMADASDAAPRGPACEPNGRYCPDTDFCLRGLGYCREPGECREKPGMCPKVLAEVCGCDGKTYPNECVANEAGVSVESEGPCE